jgi:hypothetical protein
MLNAYCTGTRTQLLLDVKKNKKKKTEHFLMTPPCARNFELRVEKQPTRHVRLFFKTVCIITAQYPLKFPLGEIVG